MLRDGVGFNRIIICCGRVNLTKGVDGLAAFVRLNYGLNTWEKGTVFLFCGRRADRIKGILFEGDGILLIYKRLAKGNRLQWPRTPEEAREITPEQFRRLMEGFTIEGTIKEVFPKLPEEQEATKAAG